MASVVFIESGQCGNQVSYDVISRIYKNIQANSATVAASSSSDLNSDLDSDLEMFFRSNAKGTKTYARSVCLDTEPKVIHECMAAAKATHQWQIDPKSVAYRHGGAGNNWAMGYRMCSGEFLEIASGLVSRELELCDANPVLLSVHSMAGGTGSGLGARMTEALRDDFPDVTRLNLSILPYHFGEVVVQHYNALMSLSKTTSASHAVVLFENEVAQDLCKRARNIERPRLSDINAVIAANIVPILLPKYEALPHCDTGGSRRCSIVEDLTHLCAHPGYRILDVKTVPQTSDASVDFTFDSWSTLYRSLLRMQVLGVWSEIGLSSLLSGDRAVAHSSPPSVKGAAQHVQGGSTTAVSACHSLAMSLTIRGRGAREAAHADMSKLLASCQSTAGQPLRSGSTMWSSPAPNRSLLTADSSDGLPPCPVSPIVPEPLKVAFSDFECNRYQRSASLLSNSQSCLPVLRRITAKAADLYSAGAYVHQYTSCGLEHADFQEAFYNVGQIVENYASLG